MEQQIVGLDVGKAWLDGYLPASGRRFRVGSDPAGIEDLLRSLDAPADCLMVMEASGGYERTAHKALAGHGVPAAIVNPKRVRDFARGMGLEAKTDRVDAQVIARYGAVMRPAATPLPDPARLELREILACRRQLVDEIATRKQQLEQLTSPAVRAQVEKTLAFLRQEAKALLALLRARIAADATLAADYALLTSMPGCGPILAATLLAELPELGTLDRRKVAALAGLAPIARDSGLREHRRVIKGGRGQARNALYMAALASLKTDKSPLKARYAQLTAKGKPPKLALTALMRKMLVTLNAMLKAKTSWQDPRQN
ncbi:MAG: IS110 family transposase [Geminicoccaceae bacterium]